MKRSIQWIGAWIAAATLVGCNSDRPHGSSDAGLGGDLAASFYDFSVAGGDFAEPSSAKVYAHSDSDLYQIDPDLLTVTHVGPFGWPPGMTDTMTDIALDKDGNMIGISFSRIFSIDPMTAKCTFLANFMGVAGYNGLSFISADQLEGGTGEILVGANVLGNVDKIDPMSGQQTTLGKYGSGYGSSGDIVSVEGATYATVGGKSSTSDQLVSVNAQTGVATPIGTGIGFGNVWGLGYWRGNVFGFTYGGDFILIDVKTGVGKLVQHGSVQWFGAGVTTAAPTVPLM